MPVEARSIRFYSDLELQVVSCPVCVLELKLRPLVEEHALLTSAPYLQTPKMVFKSILMATSSLPMCSYM